MASVSNSTTSRCSLVAAVSYTHLDVYKRQTLSITKTINHREEGTATEEYQEVVELLTEAVVGILQACLLYTSRCV